jgi:hypothetical protein
VVRIVGDLSDDLAPWRVWGGLLNAVALALFVVNVGRSIAVTRGMTAVRTEQPDQPPMAPIGRGHDDD